MNEQKIKEKYGIILPSSMKFNLEEGLLTITLTKKSIEENMQKNNASFEGWAICLKANIEDIDKVCLKLDAEVEIKDCTPNSNQFFYRIRKFKENYDWVELDDSLIIEQNIFRNVEAVVNFPKSSASETAIYPEAKMERDFVNSRKNNNAIIDHQLPLGVFLKEIAKTNRLLPTAFLDIWELEGNTLRIYELKDNNNSSVGIISELMYYVNIILDLKRGDLKYPEGAEKSSYRSFNHFRDNISKIKNISAVFLAPSLHPLISGKKEAIIKILSNNIVKYEFQETNFPYTLAISYREQELERQKNLLNKTENNVFPESARGGGLHRSYERDFCLSAGKESHNLFEEIRESCENYFKEEGISFWGGSDIPNHILSSQVACLNHLFAIREDKDAVTSLAKKLCDGQFDVECVEKVCCDKDPQYIAFEVVTDKDHLNEDPKHQGLRRGEYCTSIDAVIVAKLTSGDRLLLPIEWKYTESYGPHDKSKEDDPKKPMIPEAKGKNRLERYSNLIHNHLNRIEPSKEQENPSQLAEDILPYRGSIYFQDPYYQLMRQTLWAEQLIVHSAEERIKANNYLHINVIPESNADLLNKGYDKYSKMEEAWKSCLKDETKYKIVDPKIIGEVLNEYNDSKKYSNLMEYLKTRYWEQ